MAIVSHKHRFIFIKTRKTAGTSIEIALASVCGPQDVLAPISTEDERTRLAAGYRGKQNYYIPLSQLNASDWRTLLSTWRRPRYCNHMTAKELKQRVGDKVWNSYYKFCFERNPWDKVVSSYFWQDRNREQPQDWQSFLEEKRHLIARCFEQYTIDGQVIVDRVCRFENIPQEYEWMKQQFNLPQLPSLGNAKASVRKDRRHYSDILPDFAAEQIANDYAPEIKLMGYTFDKPAHD